MSITKYKAFVKVAELGSLTKAAAALEYSQPGISHMINSLEQEFGFSLLNRNRDSCTLTENGKTVLYYCSQIVKNEDDLTSMVQSLNGLMSGTIRIGATASMMIDYVPKAVKAFSAIYPAIKIDLFEGLQDNILTGLQNGVYDVAFHAAPSLKSFDFVPLFNDPVCLILPPGHPLCAYDRVPVRRLSGLDFIMPINAYSDNCDIVTRKHKLNLNIKYETASDLAALGLVECGLGVSLISAETAKYMHCEIVKKEFDEDFHREMGVSVPSLKHTTPAVRAFIESLKDMPAVTDL